MAPLRIILAEDHVLMRAGLRLLVEQMQDVSVVGEAGDGLEALRLAHAHHPDIAVLDIAMSGMNGLDLAERLRQELPDIRVIMLSMHATDSYIQRALRAGARGYLLKDAAPVELTLAISAVARGETYLSPAIASQLVQRVVQNPAAAQSGVAVLTPRQRDILRLIAEGLTTQAIANRLQISVKTVEGHRTQLMERLNIHDVAGLVRFAIREGLISDDLS